MSGNREFHDWEMWLLSCKVFFEVNGRLPGAGDTNEWGSKIGLWLTNQRRKFREKKLSNERIRQFEEILGAAWNPRAERWGENLRIYKDYVDKTGKQPNKFTRLRNINIGLWLYRLRSDPGSLSRAQIAELNAVGMRWIRDPLDSNAVIGPTQLRKNFARQTDNEWYEHYFRYKEYVINIDRTLSVDRHKEKHTAKDLNLWLDVQKNLYKKDKLSARRRTLIDNLMLLVLQTRSI